MSTLTIRNVPKELHERLKQRAQVFDRSVNSEAILCLERGVVLGPRPLPEILASLERVHEMLKDLPPLDDDFLDQAKHEGRP